MVRTSGLLPLAVGHSMADMAIAACHFSILRDYRDGDRAIVTLADFLPNLPQDHRTKAPPTTTPPPSVF